jgi:hypothetical protein
VKAIQAASVSSFKAMLRDRGDISSGSRWSRVRSISLNIHHHFWFVAFIYSIYVMLAKFLVVNLGQG